MEKASKLEIARNNNKYKYVCKCGNKYVVRFYIDGKNVQFGTFNSEEGAAKVTIEKARENGKVI